MKTDVTTEARQSNNERTKGKKKDIKVKQLCPMRKIKDFV
jgi:hypothetical protein